MGLGLAVALGTVLRLRQYLHARSLWLDEAMLANNILARNFHQLLQPLETDQSAPVPFLWAVKLATLAGGAGERALRLIPLLAGLGLLVACAALARRLLAPWPAVLAVLLVALSPELIYFSNEVKPYSGDTCLTAVLLLLALALHDRPDCNRRWMALGLAGALAATGMVSAPLVLGGIGLALLLDTAVRRAAGAVPRLILLGAAWAGLFLTEYVTLYRTVTQSPYMRRFWMPWYLVDSPPGIFQKIHFLSGDALMRFFLAEGGLWRWEASLLLILPIGLGVAALYSRWGLWIPAILLLPLGLAIPASVVRLYPLAPRLLLFAVPPLALLVAAGAASAADWLRARWRLPWLAGAAAVLTVLPALDAARQLLAPYQREEAAPVVREFLAEHSSGSAVYVFGRTVPAWTYYTTDWRHPDLARVNHLSQLVGSGGAAFSYAPPRGHPVGREGDSLSFSWGGWRELVGLPGGRGPDSLGVTLPNWDEGWADNEVRRIRAAGPGEAWVIYTSAKPGTPDPLDSAMTATGARIALRRTATGAMVTRWVWEPKGEE